MFEKADKLKDLAMLVAEKSGDRKLIEEVKMKFGE